jgi:hypothetical protein
MKNLDVNEDQRLSKEEFIQGLKQDPFLRGLMNPFQNDCFHNTFFYA